MSYPRKSELVELNSTQGPFVFPHKMWSMGIKKCRILRKLTKNKFNFDVTKFIYKKFKNSKISMLFEKFSPSYFRKFCTGAYLS
jgi:hypothetical protein